MKRKKKILIWVVTFAFIIATVTLIAVTITTVQKQTGKHCFRYLEETTKQLANELNNTAAMDHEVLSAMAEIISVSDDNSDTFLCGIMNSYNCSASYVSYIELLRPDNTILYSDGTVRDAGDNLIFAEEAEKGAYISDIVFSVKDENERIVRNAVPVVKNGSTEFMLYGVVQLTEFAKQYKTNIYNGNAYVHVEDGNTGDYLMDTWHNTFGNMTDFYDRETLTEDTFQDAEKNMKQGIPGNLAFVSVTTGDVLYMHYEPVGINNWNAIVTVQDRYALMDSHEISSTLYQMAAMIGILVFLYMIFIVGLLFQAYRHIRKIGLYDEVTGLQNRNAYETFTTQNQNQIFDRLACIYIDANGLHEINNHEGHEAGDQALRSIAEALKQQFPAKYLYRVGGDEFVVIIEDMAEEDCLKKAECSNAAITEKGYSVSYGVAAENNVTGCMDVIRLADARMLEYKKKYYETHDRRQR